MGDFKDTIVKITKGVTKTSGELLKSTKLSLALASEEDKLKQIYMEIGKKVHEIYQYGGSLGKFFDEKYSEILKTEAGIKDLKDQMDSLKGVRACTKCGASVDRNAGFCPKCGMQMDAAAVSAYTAREPESYPEKTMNPNPPIRPEVSMKPEPAPKPEIIPKRETIICRNCHAENEPGSKFCLTCGRLLQP